MNQITKSCRGSMTVEAAFILPIIVFVIFALMYLMFYCGDQIKLTSFAVLSCQLNANGKELEKQKINLYINEEYSGGILADREVTITTETKVMGNEICFFNYLELPMPDVLSYWESRVLIIRVHTKEYNPCRIVRIYEAFKGQE
ncbi:TadE/TadG family type IV pilus assembly protein [Anaeromicropila populeti]|uniref:TadE-like protein n=1 Tax=Anaeromicropila populeti TaxID=37658 RepID=A0A1I6LS61_9FIRM|nr:TadE family protein [Anaeromicropila populeti]SFS06283.1 hypothetical protein SAMN05661086_03527 [Anaeromicropila populeti]